MKSICFRVVARLAVFAMVLWPGRGPLAADGVLLLVKDSPPSGQLVSRVDLTAAAGYAGLLPLPAAAIRLARASDGQAVPLQFIADPDYDPTARIAGTLVAQVDKSGEQMLRLSVAEELAALMDGPKSFAGTVSTPWYEVDHKPAAQGGLPSRIRFPKTGKSFDNFRWQDRVHSPERGGYLLRDGGKASVEKISEGPFCTVIRVRANYTRGEARPESRPAAVYDWYYFHDRPLVFVSALQTQERAFSWREWHFLELNFPGDDFPNYLGGDPKREGHFSGSTDSARFSQYGAISDGSNIIAVVGSGDVLVYDGRGGYGNYLHALPGLAWSSFDGTSRRVNAWLCMTSDEHPANAVAAARREVPAVADVLVSVDSVHERLESLRSEESPGAGSFWWRAPMVDTLQRRGQFEAAMRAASGPLPDGWHVLAAGQLGLILSKADGGVRLEQLVDRESGRNLLAAVPLPLFELTMQEVREAGKNRAEAGGENAAEPGPGVCRLCAAAGWNEVEVVLPAAEGLQIIWRSPRHERLDRLAVTARVAPDHKRSALRWNITVDNPTSQWTTWRMVFPQVALANLGQGAEVFLPRGSGEVQSGLWQRAYRHQGTYPNGWTAMAFMAAYDAERRTGLYFGMHDPWGSTKDLLVESRPTDGSVVFAFDHPAVEMGREGNDFQTEGEGVWQLLRGDWFDAAMIYRDWVRREARWYPELGPDGRADTAIWMRELPVWLLGGGGPEGFTPAVEKFAQFAGVPVGVHWYNWHQIPFDNDYPHYFPTKDGFAAAAAALRKKDVYVMPYINGRLWDTRDRGLDDFEFTSVARAAATKDEEGAPYVETYGSKEADGSSVRLAVMCPATDLWKQRQRAIVLRLMTECHVAGVYMDQIAAARPVLCFDPSHGHPLGGGHWWTESYWDLLKGIREAMPADRILTTECNAEPYIRWFDGYLTWHWQNDGQVPAFPAVYGGSIQMFGRAYRGGETKNRALRMKAGQQLVFGEQIGWFAPDVIHEEENAAFLRQIIGLRWRLRRYFHAGEMARPPRLAGEIPRITADWQWSGHWPVTTDAVLAGAWALPREQRLVLLVVNVGDEPVATGLDYELSPYGFDREVKVSKLEAGTEGEPTQMPPRVKLPFTIPGRTAWAWEVKP